MTRDEAVDFWSRLFRISMPEMKIKPWQVKLLSNTNRYDYLVRNKEEIDQDIFIYPAELQAAVGASLVKWAYTLRIENLDETMKSIANKLFVLGYVRESTVQAAARRRMDRKLVFNTNASFGPATASFDELDLEEPHDVEIDHKGRLRLTLREKVIADSKKVSQKLFTMTPDLKFGKLASELLEEWESLPL